MCLLTRKCLLVFKLIVQFVANVKAEKEETVFVDRVGARLCVWGGGGGGGRERERVCVCV